MPTPVNGVNGSGAERAGASADIIAEARQRQADRLRAAQAENTKPTEVVEQTAKSDGAENARKSINSVQPYRVKLDPDSRRLYTEVLDTETGDIIMRIPAGYTDPADPAPDDAEFTAPPKGEVEA